MATSNNSRDVKMTLAVETLGEENIKRMQDTISDLAKEGGDAAPEFQKLADEIGRMGEQSKALTTFQALSDQTQELATRQASAGQASADLRTKLDALSATSSQASQGQALIAAALDAARSAARATRDELDTLTATTDRAGRTEAEYVANVERLKVAKIAQRAEIERLSAALTQSNQTVRVAEQAESKLASAYQRAQGATAAATAALNANHAEVKQAASAAQTLGVSTGNVAAAQAQLVQSLNRSGTAALALNANVQRLAEGSKQSADAARLAGERIAFAFQTVGVKSAQQLQAEITDVRAGMETLRSSAGLTGSALNTAFAAGQGKINALEREIRQVSGTMTLADRAAVAFKGSLSQIAVGNVIADGVGYLVNKVKELGVAFVTTIVEAQQMRRALNAIYKDTRVAGEQFDFLRKTASASGVAIGDISQSFTRFSASMKGAGIPLQDANNLFESLSRAAGTLGLTGEQAGGALDALGQIASKGVVSMEELRQQLGDRIPGALSVAAKGLGIADAELIKLVESGQLAARDFIPGFTKGLREMHGEVTGIIPAWNQLKNSLTVTAETAGDSVWTQVLASGLQTLGVVADALGRAFIAVSSGLEVAGKGAGILAGALVTLTNPLDALREMVQAVDERWEKYSKTIDKTVEGTGAAAASQENLNASMSQATQTAGAAIAASSDTERALKLQAYAAQLVADSTVDLSSKSVQFGLASATALAAQEKDIEVKDKLAKATKLTGDATTALVSLRGSEQESLVASADASAKYLDAIAASAAAQQGETEILKIQKVQLEQNAAARGLGAEVIRAEVQELDNKIRVSAAETEQAQAAVVAAQNEAAARELARKTYEDNSASIEEFRRTAVLTTEALIALTEGFGNGTVTQELLSQAQRDAAAAAALYNDALSDSSEKIAALSELEQANYNLKLAGLSVQEQAYQRLSQAARASGDLAKATYYEIEARRIQIKITALVAEAKTKEAQASILAAEQEMAQLRATNSLTEVKRLEIEARLANAKAKLIEAGASKDIIAAMEREISLIREGSNAREQSRGGIGRDTDTRHQNTQSINSQADALERLTRAKDRYSAPISQRDKVDVDNPYGKTSDGFTANKDGSAAGTFGNNIPLNAAFEIANKAKSGKLTSGDLELAKQGFEQAMAARQWLASINQGSVSFGANRTAQDKVNETRNALEKVQSLVQQEARQSNENTSTGVDRDAEPTGRRGANTTVNINIGGRKTAVNVASQADANALTGLLRQLESASGVSN